MHSALQYAPVTHTDRCACVGQQKARRLYQRHTCHHPRAHERRAYGGNQLSVRTQEAAQQAAGARAHQGMLTATVC